jgi:uncharacterized protein YaaR (DUF327 family)
MKISQDMRAQLDAVTKNGNSQLDGKRSFGGIMQSQTQLLKRQELQELMKDITRQGNRLARSRSFRDLATFKLMVKGFLQETVKNGLNLQKSHHFSGEGQNRQLIVVKEVNDKLIDLTEEMMSKEKKTVDLLGIIGEIKGLLFNIYG